MGRVMCFTGRRPKDLFGYQKDKYISLVNKLVTELEKFYLEGFDIFITGGAQGFDQLAFWAVNKLKQKGYPVKNIVYIPFLKQELKWLEKGLFSQSEYRLMLKMADEIKICSPDINVSEANKWEINSASIFLILFS